MNWQPKPIAALITGLIATLYFNVIFCEEIDKGRQNSHKTLQVVDMKLTFASTPTSKNTEKNQQSMPPEAVIKPPEPIKKAPLPEVPKPVAKIIKAVKYLVAVPIKKTIPVKKVELVKHDNKLKTNEKDVENNSQTSPLPALAKSVNSIGRVQNSGIGSTMQTYMAEVRHYIAKQKRYPKEANDYRYFPDPDLLPVVLDDAFIAEVKKTLPELPDAKRSRFIEQYELKPGDAGILTVSRAVADYFEATVAAFKDNPKVAANWITGELSAALNRDGFDISDSKIAPADLAALLSRIQDGTISGKIAKEVFEAMWTGGGGADEIIEAKGLRQITDSSAIEKIVDAVIAANPDQVEQYRAGKDKVLGFFVGQVMKETGGKANPGQVNEVLKGRLRKG